jgi:hypothetical protein
LYRSGNNYPGFQDQGSVDTLGFLMTPAIQPFFMEYVDDPPLGTCQVFAGPNGSPNAPATPTYLDAGPQLTITAPNGDQKVLTPSTFSGGTAPVGHYRAVISANGSYLLQHPGDYTISAPGGKDLNAFNLTITVPSSLPTMTSPPPEAAAPFAITRANGLTVTWIGGSANGTIEIDVYSATDQSFNYGASAKCIVPSSSGSFTIPPNVLMALPAGSFAGLDFQPRTSFGTISGPNINFSQTLGQFDFAALLTVK